MYKIEVYNNKLNDKMISFFKTVFKENGRKIDLAEKDVDITRIPTSYLSKGNFWCAIDEKNRILGTVAIRALEDFFEIRRFFVLKKEKNKGIGQKLLTQALEYAIDNGIALIKAGTMEDGHEVHHIFEKFGFVITKKYSNSSADIFYKLVLDANYVYNFQLTKLRNAFENSLILNPTENIPMYNMKCNSDFFEGLYVSERFKDVNDKVIFAGRNNYIKFFESIKQEWKKRLNAYDIDLKTLSGLNAHLILFLCVAKSNETIMLLPEICGGHFATTKILENLGLNVIHMVPDIQRMKVDVEKTKEIIEKYHPKYIFVDRSEGLIYEDFSWISEYNFSYKIFDASQYLSQILTGTYQNPFNMGFDMIVSTLHKNYPGPQKGIIAVNSQNDVWTTYLQNAKTYISNTHPMAIAKSLMPILDIVEFNKYSELNIVCCKELEELLLAYNVPVVKRETGKQPTLHIWILCASKEESYEYFLKLEQLNILTNYRLFPYNLGYGLRIGISAAVRSGLRPKHLKELAMIMATAYTEPINNKLRKRAYNLIKSIKTTEEL